MANLLAAFPIMYLSSGTCVANIVLGGSTAKMLYQTLSGGGFGSQDSPLTSIEWSLVFTFAAVILSQLPNLNSIAGVSLIGAITAVGYCTSLWVVSVTEGRLPNVSYNPVGNKTQIAARVFEVLNALGIIAFAFRGHNLTLEIQVIFYFIFFKFSNKLMTEFIKFYELQATMPSSEKHPSAVPMWKGVKAAYLIIAICLFPLAVGGYWSYGQLVQIFFYFFIYFG